jgi:hypothetical protein
MDSCTHTFYLHGYPSTISICYQWRGDDTYKIKRFRWRKSINVHWTPFLVGAVKSILLKWFIFTVVVEWRIRQLIRWPLNLQKNDQKISNWKVFLNI